MRKVVVTTFVSLDGVMEAPEKWSFPYWNDEIAKFKHDELFATGAHLLGRNTYEIFAGSWPSRAGADDFSDRMNALPKYVVSSQLQKADWNNSTILRGGLPQAVAEIRSEGTGDLLVGGSATLAQGLESHGLVDEWRLLTYPLILGSGKRLFNDGPQVKLRLVETRPFASGVVLLRYEPGPAT